MGRSIPKVRRTAQIMVALLLGFSLGMQWTVLQSVAWAAMLAGRTAESGLTDAVRTTFDGRHPCSLCRVVQHGQDTQKDHETRFSLKKFDVTIHETATVAVLLRDAAPGHAPVVERAEARSEPPALRPPRVA